MKCIPGKSSRDFCLTCNKPGIITGYVAPMVVMQCPVCAAIWKTISAICDTCRRPSRKPQYSECAYCRNKKAEERRKQFDV